MRSVPVLALAALVASLAVTALAAPAADAVTSLPDMPGPFPSKHYSGYLNGTNGARLHYYFVEAIEVPAANAPVVFWTNGGPGCSSMDGWGYELGPFHFRDFNAKGPVMTYNNFTWARIANILFVENPPGVGFSWRPGGNYTTTDSQNAQDNFAALKDFFTSKFPEYAKNDLWISGESYAGIYVPTLSRLVVEAPHTFPGFQGMLVGNGVTSATYDDNFYWSDAQFANGHGFMTDATLAAVKSACAANPGNATECAKLTNAYYTEMAPDVNTYDYSGRCFNPPKPSDLFLPALRRRITAQAQKRGMTPEQFIAAEQARAQSIRASMRNTPVPPSPPGGNVPCIDSVTMTTYLNRGDVKAALHVEPSLTWAICSGINYKSDILDVVDVYNQMVANSKRVLIYNGNTDMSVPYTGTRAWIAHEASSWTVSRELKGWAYDNSAFPYGPQQGGFAESYQQGAIWFTLINGAGHMVPQFRPAAAYAMFERFISGKGF